MKKALSLILTLVILLGVCATGALALSYDRPFDSGVLGSETFRIPALYTLNDGSVIAVADKRYESGLDSPANIDIGYALSADGYTAWNYGTLNSFADYADGVTDVNSAFFDTANLLPSTLSVTTSFVAVYLTFRRSPYFALAYATNDIILIILWVLASIYDMKYISVVVCFAAFLINDIYGFISWRKIKIRQSQGC